MIPASLVENVKIAEVNLIEVFSLLNHLFVNNWPDQPSFQQILKIIETITIQKHCKTCAQILNGSEKKMNGGPIRGSMKIELSNKIDWNPKKLSCFKGVEEFITLMSHSEF